MTVQPEPTETRLTTKSSISLPSDQVNMVVSVIEARGRTAEWHPLVSRVSEMTGDPKASGSVQEWEGIVAGIPVSGVSEVVTWEPGQEYAFFNTERSTGLGIESRISVRTQGNQGQVSAAASLIFPTEASALVDHAEVSRFLGNAVRQALVNLAAVARGEPVGSGAGQS
jgi:hypothetical protein